MILKEIPQRSNRIVSYNAQGNILEVTVDGVTESFDLSHEQELSEIETTLPSNPIVNVQHKDDDIIVTVLRYYGEDEKHLFEK